MLNDSKPIQDISPYSANISLYYLYICLYGFAIGLILAIWVIFLQEKHGLSLTMVTIIDILFWMTMAVSEVPTGIVADVYGRKTSIIIGITILGVSTLIWGLASSIFVMIVSFMALGFGLTFLSGAQDAFLFESLKLVGRGHEYTKIAGRVIAMNFASTAIGSVCSGFLATLDLTLPFIVSGVVFLLMLTVVIKFKEPLSDATSQKTDRSYFEILQYSFSIMREKPILRYAIIYLTIVPFASVVLEIVLIQPQALALGIPIATVGIVVMFLQIANMSGSTLANRVRQQFGQGRTLYMMPVLLVILLVALGLVQTMPALILIMLIVFFAAILRPILLNIIQNEVSDDIRATVMSMQSLLFTAFIAVTEPILGFMVDESGFATAYFAIAAGLSLFIIIFFYRSRAHFPPNVVS